MNTKDTPMTKLRLAIVGAGPAGIYAADILLKAERKFDVSIDLFDHLPAPYGLVRYGVAPDHPRIKGIITALRDVLDRGDIRIFGNVRFGEDITLDDLKQHYNAVIFATGAIRDAALDIPGIDAVGSYGAADFVSWYDGHPDFPREWPLDAASVASSATATSRSTSRACSPSTPRTCSSPRSPRTCRRGSRHRRHRRARVRPPRPAQVKFTPLELRELGELRDVDMVVYDEDFDYDEASRAAIASNKQVMVIDRVLQSWRSATPSTTAGRRRVACTCTSGRSPSRCAPTTPARRGARVRAHAPDGRAASSARASCARCRSSSCTARSATSVRRSRACPSTRSTA
jgi:ferredoxin--NADP+ reductase